MIPFGGDQPFWGDRVYQMGCGPKPIRRELLTVRNLTKALIQLTTRDEYRTAAGDISHALKAERGVQRAADVVESAIQGWKRP